MSDAKKGGRAFLVMFWLMGLLFVTILGVVYVISKKANPIMLDDQGRPQQTQHS
jgi:preprotein translocase subunit SecG